MIRRLLILLVLVACTRLAAPPSHVAHADLCTACADDGHHPFSLRR